MKISKIKSIKIEGRGRYRDIYGNPYWAWKADVNVERHNHNVHMILYEPMSWGTSSESRVLDEAIEGINQTLDINLRRNDKRIEYTYRHVSGDEPLRNPQNWK